MYALKIGQPLGSITNHDAVARAISQSNVVGLDIETGFIGTVPYKNKKIKGKMQRAVDYDTLTPATGEIKSIQIFIPALNVSVMLTGNDTKSGTVLAALLAHIQNPDKTTVIHNALYEGAWFREKFGVTILNAYCTQLAHQLLTAGLAYRIAGAYKMGSNTLKVACYRLLGVDIDKTEQSSDWCGELTDAQIQYALLDPFLAYRLYYVTHEQVLSTDAGVAEMGAIPVFIELNHNGIPASIDKLMELLNGYESRAQFHYREMMFIIADLLVDRNFKNSLMPKSTKVKDRDIWEPNLNSHAQVKTVINKLLELLGREPLTSTKAANLEMVDIPFTHHLTKYRTLDKLSQYARTFIANYNPATGRVTCKYNVLAIQAIGRSSASGGSLQIVSNTSDLLAREGLRGLKTAFLNKELLGDLVGLKCDFAASHAAIAQDLSQDRLLLLCASKGEKLHYHTLKRILELMGATLSFSEIKRVIESKDKSFSLTVRGQIRDYYWLAGMYTISKNAFYSFLNFAGSGSLRQTFAKKGIISTLEECKIFLQACREMYQDLYQFQKIEAKKAERSMAKIIDRVSYDKAALVAAQAYSIPVVTEQFKFLCMATELRTHDGRFIHHPAVLRDVEAEQEHFFGSVWTSRPSQVVSSHWLGVEATVIKSAARDLMELFKERPHWKAEIVGFAHDELPIICSEEYYSEVAKAIYDTFDLHFKRYAPHYKGDKIDKLSDWENTMK